MAAPERRRHRRRMLGQRHPEVAEVRPGGRQDPPDRRRDEPGRGPAGGRAPQGGGLDARTAGSPPAGTGTGIGFGIVGGPGIGAGGARPGPRPAHLAAPTHLAAEPAAAVAVAPAPFTPVAVISVTELDSFVQLVGDAERRAAQAEARLQANGVMMQFLRDRAEELQRRLDRQEPQRTEPAAGPHVALERLEVEIRRLRSYVARGGGGTGPAERAALRASYDAALVCAGVCLGLRSPFRLGDPLTAGDRASLTEALAASGFAVT